MDKPQWLCVLRPTRPEMLTAGPTTDEQATVGRHAAYADGLGRDGVMLMVGRTQTTSADTMGLAVFLAANETEARKIMENDPAIKEGVIRGELFPYKIAFGNVDSFRGTMVTAG